MPVQIRKERPGDEKAVYDVNFRAFGQDAAPQGVGTALTEAGLAERRAAGVPFVVVIGHPGYYPKFGFETASKYGIRCEYEQVPEEASMILIFDKQAFQGVHGVAKQRPEFAAAI